MSWVKQKATPNLKEAKAETIVARPSLGKELSWCGGKTWWRRERRRCSHSWRWRGRPQRPQPLKAICLKRYRHWHFGKFKKISILVLKQTRFYQRGRFLVLRSHCSHLHTWSLVDCILIQVWFNFWIIFNTRVSTFQIKLLRCSMFYKEQLWILPQTLEAFNQLNLLLWQHPGKDLSSVDNPLEQLGVLSRWGSVGWIFTAEKGCEYLNKNQ